MVTTRAGKARREDKAKLRSALENEIKGMFKKARTLVDDAISDANEADSRPLQWASDMIAEIQNQSKKLSIDVSHASLKIYEVIEAKRQERIKEALAGFQLNDRVTVDQYEGRGTVVYVGENWLKRTPRLGIEMDQPVGKGSGHFGGITYYRCRDKHGLLVHPNKVRVVTNE